MKRFAGCAAAALALAAGLAAAEDFSADIVTTGGSSVFQGTLFSSKDKTRIETPESVVITRMDKRVVWVLMPAENMYMEQPLQSKNILYCTDLIPGELERTFVGTDTVDGRQTRKYRIVYIEGAARETVFQWFTTDSHIPIKTAAEDGRWSTEYRNVRAGPQPGSVFEIPAGYRKFQDAVPALPAYAGSGGEE